MRPEDEATTSKKPVLKKQTRQPAAKKSTHSRQTESEPSVTPIPPVPVNSTAPTTPANPEASKASEEKNKNKRMSSDDEIETGGVEIVEPTWELQKDRGNAEFNAGRFQNAVKYYSEAIQMKPDEASLYSNRAAAYLKTREFRQALDDAKKAIALDKHFCKAYNRAATAACNLGDFNEGLRLYKEGVVMACGTPLEKELKEGEKNAQMVLRTKDAVKAALDKKDFAGALRQLAPCNEAYPDCFDLALMRAHARAMSNPTGAIADLNAFASTHSDHPDFLYVRAIATYHGSGSTGTKNAQVFLKRALECDPENERCKALHKKVRTLERLREEGNTAFKEKRWQEAIDKYTAAMDEDLSNKLLVGLLAGNRAAARMELKDYAGALRDCNTSISNGNDAPKIYARRARIHEKLEKYDDALKDIQTAADADESFAGELREMKIIVKQSKRKNYYKILGIERDADESQIKKAYRTKALEFHPDRWAHSTEEEQKMAEAKFKEIGEALSVLSDPKKRRMYDNGQLDNDVEGSQGGPGGMGGMPADMDMMNIFNMMFAGGGGADFGGMGGMGGMPRGRRSRGGFGGGMPPGFF